MTKWSGILSNLWLMRFSTPSNTNLSVGNRIYELIIYNIMYSDMLTACYSVSVNSWWLVYQFITTEYLLRVSVPRCSQKKVIATPVLYSFMIQIMYRNRKDQSVIYESKNEIDFCVAYIKPIFLRKTFQWNNGEWWIETLVAWINFPTKNVTEPSLNQPLHCPKANCYSYKSDC